ncbi:unnamed protein product [Lampetra fluviatilis]
MLTMATQATTSAVALVDAPTLPAISTTAIVQEAAAITQAEVAPTTSATAPDLTAASPAVQPSAMHRLPPVRAFSAAAGDWTTFRRRSEAAYHSVDWSADEALQALPMALDDDSLAAFYSISEADCSSFTDACSAMAANFDSPSNIHVRFLLRKRRDTETAGPVDTKECPADLALFANLLQLWADRTHHQELSSVLRCVMGSPEMVAAVDLVPASDAQEPADCILGLNHSE